MLEELGRKICPYCKKGFTPKKSHYARRKYCSKICMDLGRITHEIRQCKICTKQFKFYKSVKGATGQYCSLQCKGLGMRVERPCSTCFFCKKTFNPSLGYKQKKYCSKKCYTRSMIGQRKASFWEIASKKDQLDRLRKSFEKYVIKNENGCWGWKGCLSKKYGSLQYGVKHMSIGAHRASWLLHKGDIPDGLYVCHSCDNPVCTNPDHLFLGTPTMNVQDMLKKGRNKTPKGQDAPGAKLDEKAVLQIKALLMANELSFMRIAKMFNVALSTIYDIKAERTWSHIS